MKNTIQIEAYSLFEFCQKIQESIVDGYRFNFESNEMFPTAFGSLLFAGLEKAEEQNELPKINPIFIETDQIKQVTEEPVKSRKTKNN